ncbi:hypothetical protein SAMN04488109_2077 [Chryseolinea serpens]|uniref:Uncharacterized protein n=2 Tax=Chryseolinea serpens TaxID=947013 RepID=A0A1M5N2W8_9BACT|nr:hypothetical protein SAMN04488109_2077 [Chryseolinea serpens]
MDGVVQMMGKKINLFYVATTGILSYMIADILHEVVGHGVTCIIIGNKVELLTSVYFKSSPGNAAVDIGGPFANLIFGCLTFYVLRKTSFARLLLFQVAAYNLFWFSGTILHSAISNGDWTFAINEIIAEPFGKLLLIISGILSYILVIRYLNTYLDAALKNNQGEPLAKQDIFVSFLFAAAAALLAGLLFKPDRLQAAMEGLLEMAASLPILFLKFRENSFAENHNFSRLRFFGLIVCVLYLFFCLTLGQGIS